MPQYYFILPFIFALMCSANAEEPFADIHIHYNWDQAEVTSVSDVVKELESANTQLALISSTPTELALSVRQAAGDWVVPLFSPYTHELGKRDWYRDKGLLEKVEKGLRSKTYFGIGEIHLMAGYPPNASNPNFLGLMALAKKYNVPVLLHVDSGDEHYFLNICQKHNDVKILFAHAGGNLSAKHIERVLNSCPNVWVEFSARDPWRYGGLTDDTFVLLKEWSKLVLNYSDRVLTGTDPVWRVTRTQSWDQSDDGWNHYQKLFTYHQKWIAGLPKSVQKKIRWENAKTLLGLH